MVLPVLLLLFDVLLMSALREMLLPAVGDVVVPYQQVLLCRLSFFLECSYLREGN